MAGILWDVIAPVFILMGLGYLVEKRREMDTRTLSTLALYLLNPALTFRAILNTHLSIGVLGQISLFILLLAGTNYLTVRLAARAGRVPATLQDAFLVTVLFMNSGHFGVPVNYFAFGQSGFDMAVMFMAIQTCLTNSLAVFLMSRGKNTVAGAAKNVLRMPLLYAFLLGWVFRMTGHTPGGMIMKSVDLLADAAIPVSLLMIGIQLAQTAGREGDLSYLKPRSLLGVENRPVLLSGVLRLVAAPLTGAALVYLLGVQGVLGKVLVVQSAAPTAVMASLLAVEYDNQAEFTSKAIFFSTLASAVTVTILLNWLR